MAKPLFPIALLLSLPLATVCLKTQGTPPQTPAGAVRPSSTTASETDDEVDAKVREAVLAAVAERHDNQLALEKLKDELEAVIAVGDAANKSASEIAARITKRQSKAANDQEQQIALVVEAFRQLLRSRLAVPLDEERDTELTLELAIQYRDFYTDMIAKLQSAKVPFASALSVEIRGPDEVLAGETAEYEIVITNKGEAELTGVRIVYRADDSLLPRRASENYRVQSGSLVWIIGVLAPGEAAKPLTVVCDTIGSNSSATTQVLCGTDQGVTTSKGLNTAIRPSATPGVTSAGTPRPGIGVTPGK